MYPGLVPSLVAHPGVGFITVRTDHGARWCCGRHGTRYLEEGRVEGADPLAPFGPSAAREVLRHSELAHVGDLVLNSPLDAGTDEVAAYEELVGNHGGLGGWQTQAVLVHPAAWPVDEAPLARRRRGAPAAGAAGCGTSASAPPSPTRPRSRRRGGGRPAVRRRHPGRPAMSRVSSRADSHPR